MPRFKYQSKFSVSPELLWSWLGRDGIFARLQPPWMEWKGIRLPESLATGEVCEFKFKKNGLWIHWNGVHTEFKENDYFVDEQVKGPFKRWRHLHQVSGSEEQTTMLDQIDYDLPFSMVSNPLGPLLVERDLSTLFRFREERLRGDLERYGRLPSFNGKVVLVTGHRGLIGSRLTPLLRLLGFEVRGLTRSPKADWEFGWDPAKGEIDPGAVKGVHAIIHLAGASIAEGRWTEARREAILKSRTESATLLRKSLETEGGHLEVFISASGINYYEADGDLKNEDATSGSSFLADVCRKWEDSANAFKTAADRIVYLRTGVVLDPSGGALSKMLLPFQFGLGGRLGSGEQHFPWIGIDDLCDLYVNSLINSDWEGPINAVAPGIVQQKQFAKVLGSVLRRPAVIPLPSKILKLVLGQMGEELLLSDLNVVSKKLYNYGFEFRTPELRQSLRRLLGKQ